MDSERADRIEHLVREAAELSSGGGTSYHLRVLLDMALLEIERSRQSAKHARPRPPEGDLGPGQEP